MQRRGQSPCARSVSPALRLIPSLENATDRTGLVWSFSVFNSAPVDVFHTRIGLSPDLEMIRLPSLEKATDQTVAWPFSLLSSALVKVSRSCVLRTRNNIDTIGIYNGSDRRGVAILGLRCYARRDIPHAHRLVGDDVAENVTEVASWENAKQLVDMLSPFL
jgi:hypothetical protein